VHVELENYYTLGKIIFGKKNWLKEKDFGKFNV